jgi:hypothetical protein
MYIVWVSKVEYLITVNDNGLGGVAKLPRIRKLMRIIKEKKGKSFRACISSQGAWINRWQTTTNR